jgi:DeoR/GlpR family transcriptional regulator of sugar metabolism
VRRDFKELARQQLATRTHGGRVVALARICTIDQVDGLVTDDVADPDQVRRLRDAGVDVTLV